MAQEDHRGGKRPLRINHRGHVQVRSNLLCRSCRLIVAQSSKRDSICVGSTTRDLVVGRHLQSTYQRYGRLGWEWEWEWEDRRAMPATIQRYIELRKMSTMCSENGCNRVSVRVGMGYSFIFRFAYRMPIRIDEMRWFDDSCTLPTKDLGAR